jgi:hypothetical protein
MEEKGHRSEDESRATVRQCRPKPFVDLRPGMSKGGNQWRDVAYAAAHVCFSPSESRRGHSDSPTITWTFGCHRNHALYAHKSRLEACSSREARNGRLATLW